MAVTVTPDTFNLVQFEAERIRAVAERVATAIGFGDVDFTIEVDETTPLGRSWIASEEPVVIHVESGIIEDPKHPRELSDQGVAETVGRHLLRVRDRRDADFAAPPADDELELPYKVAWEIYSIARLARLGLREQRQRWLYHFRNRCGFTDASDDAFDVLWTSESLTWPEIAGLVEGAIASREPEPAT
jgi:hypothetical protein